MFVLDDQLTLMSFAAYPRHGFLWFSRPSRQIENDSTSTIQITKKS